MSLSELSDYDYENEYWTIKKIIQECYEKANPQNISFTLRTKREFDRNLEEVAAQMSKSGENVLYREAYLFATNKLIEQLEVK